MKKFLAISLYVSLVGSCGRSIGNYRDKVISMQDLFDSYNEKTESSEFIEVKKEEHGVITVSTTLLERYTRKEKDYEGMMNAFNNDFGGFLQKVEGYVREITVIEYLIMFQEDEIIKKALDGGLSNFLSENVEKAIEAVELSNSIDKAESFSDSGEDTLECTVNNPLKLALNIGSVKIKDLLDNDLGLIREKGSNSEKCANIINYLNNIPGITELPNRKFIKEDGTWKVVESDNGLGIEKEQA